MIKKITSFEMDLSTMGAGVTTRQFVISGDKESKFNMQVFDSDGKFYDFTTNSFSVGMNDSTRNSKITLSGSTYSKPITFPSSSGRTYYILLFSTQELNTEFTKASGAAGKYILSKSITQIGNSTLTLAPTNSGSGMKTMPSTTLIASSTTAETTDIDISWTIENVETDANGFGLRLIKQPYERDWYFQTTETVDGAISSATEVIVDDLTDLAVGMLITAVSGGSLSGTPEITAINTNTKTLTLSAAQTFADGITLTIRAYGKYSIMSAIGVGFEFHTDSPIVGKELKAVGTPLKKSVASDAGSTTINLVGTYGVSGGGFVTILGRNVNNNGTNTIQSVSASEGAGSMVMQLDQTGVTAGTSIEFTGCTRIIKLTGVVTVTAHPNANRTINLDLDKFITLGVAS